MKFLVLAFLIGAACAKVTYNQHETPASKEFLYRQKAVLQLLEKVHIPFYYKEYEQIAKDFHPLQHLNSYEKTYGIKQIVKFYENDLLKPKGQAFSIYHHKDKQQAVYFFEALYYAKDWDTFYKTAIYARAILNEQLYVYGLTTAVLQKEITRGIKLPPQYEIFPEHFIHNHAIFQAYKSKSLKEPMTIDVNSTYYAMNNWENHLNYYTDDVGLNTFNSIFAKDFPSWWKKEDYNQHIDRQGEFYYYTHHQLTNRYNLERLSNKLPFVSEFQFNYPTVKYGYNPHAIYRNGEQFPVRYDNMEIQDVHDKQYGDVYVRDVKDYEMRLRAAIDKQFIQTEEYQKFSLNNTRGIDILGKIVYGNVDRLNPKYYGKINTYARAILGRIVDPQGKYNLAPSVIEQEVAQRDPLYYNLYKHYDQLFKKHKYHLQPYTKEEIEFQGVQVDDVQVSELETYLEPYEVNMQNIFDDETQETEEVKYEKEINARVYRLNHKPYTYKINVNSERDYTAVVRIYLAPKYDSFGEKLTYQQMFWKAFELDTFTYKLTNGKNTILRKSSESSIVVPDYVKLTELQKKVQEALEGQSQFLVNKDYRHCGFPSRLLLPRGTVEGQKYTMIVYVSNYDEEKVQETKESYFNYGSYSFCGFKNQKYPFAKPLGYPLDRVVPDVTVFKTGNMYLKDVTIKYQKHHDEYMHENMNVDM